MSAESDIALAQSGTWWDVRNWPRYRSDPFPHETVTESGLKMLLDLARDGDDLCDITTQMRHYDLRKGSEVRDAVCMMPKGHDTPHLPQDVATLDGVGRMIVRSVSS